MLSRVFLPLDPITTRMGKENRVRDAQWAVVEQQGQRLATLWFESQEELASLTAIRSYAMRRNVGGFCFLPRSS